MPNGGTSMPRPIALPGVADRARVMRDLQADIDQGKTLGVTGTPAVFINGRKMSSFLAQTLVAIIVVGTPIVMTLLESRWFIVTAADRDRGVPGTCPRCREELTAVIGKKRYTVRCGICGYRRKGPLVL